MIFFTIAIWIYVVIIFAPRWQRNISQLQCNHQSKQIPSPSLDFKSTPICIYCDYFCLLARINILLFSRKAFNIERATKKAAPLSNSSSLHWYDWMSVDCNPDEGRLLPHRGQSRPPGVSTLQPKTEATTWYRSTRWHLRWPPAGPAQLPGWSKQQGGERFAGWEMVLSESDNCEGECIIFISHKI